MFQSSETKNHYQRQYEFIRTLILVFMLDNSYLVNSLTIPQRNLNLQMVVNYPTDSLNTKIGKKIQKKMKRFTNHYSTSSPTPPLSFEDDTYFSSLNLPLNTIRYELNDRNPFHQRKFEKNRKERKQMKFSKIRNDDDFGSFLGSDLEESIEDEQILNYLPGKGMDVTPDTADILIRLTKMYLEDIPSYDPSVSTLFQETLDIIDNEYRFYFVPVYIDGRECMDEMVCKIVSFAVFHQIPFEVVKLLWETSSDNAIDRNNLYFNAMEILQSLSSYESLEFTTKKLPIRLQSKYTPKMISLYRVNALDAITEASNITPPPKKASPQVLLETIEQLSSAVPKSFLFSSFQQQKKRFEDLQFFPQRKKWVKQLLTYVNNQSQALQNIGRSCLISYGILNALWFSFAMILSWKRISLPTSVQPYPGLETPFRVALWKFSRVSTYIYLGSQLTKIPKMALAVFISPYGSKVLNWVETKFKVGANTAFAITTALLFAMCISCWSGIIFFDTLLASGGSFLM